MSTVQMMEGPLEALINKMRTALGVSGVLAVVVGVLILVRPGGTAAVVTALIAVYAIVTGVIDLAIAVFTRGMGGWKRVGNGLLGVFFVIAGIFIFRDLGPATVGLALFVGILVGVMWIVDGIVSLTMLDLAAAKGWAIFYAIISIIAGMTLLFSPLYGAIVLWWLLGIFLVVIGIMQIVRAFTLKSHQQF